MHALRALVLAAVVASAATSAPVEYRYFRLPQSLLTSESVKRTGFIRDHIRDDVYAFGYVPKDRPLPAAWQLSLRELDPVEMARHEFNPKTLRFSPEVFVGPGENYHTYTTLTSELKALAAKFPQIAKLESAGKSVQGREVWYLRVSAKRDTGLPKLLYISSMHGDEVVGKEMMVYLLRDLLNGYGKDGRLTALVDNAELFIMPSMNPDGTELRTRFNANGVDLNRDFPDVGAKGFSTEGKATETILLMNLLKANHFVSAMNFHGGALVVNLPWDHKPNPPGSSELFGDNAVALSLSQEYAKNNPPMYQNNSEGFVHGVTYGYEWYQILGGMQDWHITFNQGMHVTTELSEIVKWPSASSLPKYWTDNRESLITFLEQSMDGIHLRVTNPSGAPLSATVDISTATRSLRFPDGVVHRPTVDAKQRVRISAEGYQTQELDLVPWRFKGDYASVILPSRR